MIISKKYALKLVKEGKAKIEGRITTAPAWSARAYGTTYLMIMRYDKQRTDHAIDE